MLENSWLAGRYELVERIGSGGSACVMRAVDRAEGLDRDVCVKLRARANDLDAARDLEEEARVLARVRHANVVGLHDFVRDPRLGPALVLELVAGADLRRVMRHVRRASGRAPWLPVHLAVAIACGILRGLDAAARAVSGLVHRDVTPHNVLVSNDGEVKLVDFGIALATVRPRVTRPLFVKGKPGYMAPEQVRGDALDARTDVFAVGIVLYELLAGVRPFEAGSGMEELARIERGDTTPVARHRRLDRALSSAVGRMLEKRPEKRPSSAREALELIAPFAAGEAGCMQLAHIVRTMEYSLSLHAPPSAPTRARPARALP